MFKVGNDDGKSNFELLCYTATSHKYDDNVQNTQAFWTVLLGWMINNEKFHRIEAVGIFACFSGVIMMALSEDPVAEAEA